MGKFKVGDRVRVKPDHYIDFTCGNAYNLPRGPGTVHVGGGDLGYVMIAYEGFVSPPVNPESFELIQPSSTSAIRTVTRREIVPGAYGIVNVSRPAKPMLLPKARDYTPDELRDAARLFNQLAEVLEENAALETKEAA